MHYALGSQSTLETKGCNGLVHAYRVAYLSHPLVAKRLGSDTCLWLQGHCNLLGLSHYVEKTYPAIMLLLAQVEVSHWPALVCCVFGTSNDQVMDSLKGSV